MLLYIHDLRCLNWKLHYIKKNQHEWRIIILTFINLCEFITPYLIRIYENLKNFIQPHAYNATIAK